MIEFIVNPVSRVNSGAAYWKLIHKKLDERGLAENRDYRCHMTEYPGHATQIAADLTAGGQSSDTIVILGGDGTLNEALNGFHVNRMLTVCYIPTGSGNDFARAMKLERDPGRALEKIINPTEYRMLDYGSALFSDDVFRSRRFAVSSGMGFDAAVCRRVSSQKLRRFLSRLRLGKLIYLVSGIAQLFATKPFDGYLLIDDEKKVNFRRAMFVSAHIQPFEGGGFHFAPKADCSDGRLEICLMANMRMPKFILALILSIFGKAAIIPDVKRYACTKLEIHASRPLEVHTDGELQKERYDELQLECITRKIRMIV